MRALRPPWAQCSRSRAAAQAATGSGARGALGFAPLAPTPGARLPTKRSADIEAVPAFVPLSLLEAIRNLDTPVEDGLEELSPEIVTKRLGLSTTVAAQIERYRASTERDGMVPRDEAISVLRLVGRRTDAGLVFADAGRRAARYAVREAPARTLARVTPGSVTRRLAARAATKTARAAFGADVRFPAAMPEVRVPQPLTVIAWPDGSACGFYGAAFTELLRTLTGFEGTLRHGTCRGRGDQGCAWQATAPEGYE